jgi:hypothetical protein
MHRRRRAGLGYSGGQLDRAVRPAGMIAASRLQRGAVASMACSRDHYAVDATLRPRRANATHSERRGDDKTTPHKHRTGRPARVRPQSRKDGARRDGYR